MSTLLKEIINNIRDLSESEFTFLIKFDQNEFKLIEYSSKISAEFNFENILQSISELDFEIIQNSISNYFGFSSEIVDTFPLGNFQYYVFSASKEVDHFSKKNKKIHSNLSELLKILLPETEAKTDKSPAGIDYFHLFAKASNELVFMLDQNGTFTFMNNSGLKQLKFSEDEIIGNHFLEIVSDDSKFIAGEAFQKIINEKKAIELNLVLIPKVSLEQNYFLKLIPIFKENELENLLGIASNNTAINSEKKKSDELTERLKEAHRLNEIERDRAKQQISILHELNDLKNEFISNVSHELRTPLASIIGFSETIVEDANLTVEKAKEFSDVILTESKRLAKLINDVLDFSELENEKQHLAKSTINIIEILNDSVNSFTDECNKKNIVLTSKLPESEIVIYADNERLKKAFNYLLANAVKFTKQNGRITFIAQEFLKEVEIVISDTGIGISEQKLPLLFDKFSKVKRTNNNLPGAGFGLVTVKQIIDLHKGLIRVKSEVDKGTSFIIRLPKYSFN
ncbi:MAG: PAS domain-containing sensor histidine kinase [Ignavibacteriae bacterium]|nr:PAS domain-containing sensor histidine kinase [Ignavibacteriota bacterium]MCB9208062.1 PAS domain-containing sensor histidine kinase [Ignavibacteriales bacterium]MCB9258828.1 PAS domain-containing sensor histidine kinase [Ignavibacteriales bacterium]